MEFNGLKTFSYDILHTDQGCLFETWLWKQQSCNNNLKHNVFADKIAQGASYAYSALIGSLYANLNFLFHYIK